MLTIERLLAPCREVAGLLIKESGVRRDAEVRRLLQLSDLDINCSELVGKGVRVAQDVL